MGREKELLELFPLQMRRTYERAATQMAQIQEVRLRVGRPVMIHSQGKEKYLFCIIDFHCHFMFDRNTAIYSRTFCRHR